MNRTPQILSIGSRGFSLLELIITVAIISILASISIPQYEVFRERARNTGRVNSLATVKSLIESHKLEFDFYPLSSNDTQNPLDCNPGGAGSPCNWLDSNPNQTFSEHYDSRGFVPGYGFPVHDPLENVTTPIVPFSGWLPSFQYMSNGVIYKIMSHAASNHYSGPLVDRRRDGNPDTCADGESQPWAWAISIYSKDSPEAECW